MNKPILVRKKKQLYIINDSQLAKLKKEDPIHVPAVKSG